LFNDFGTLNSYAEQINFEFDYNIRNGDEIIPLNTTINLVNFETTLSTNGFAQNKQVADREQISKILYEPNYWKNSNTYIANTLVKELAIRKFNEMSLFGNPLLTKTDTANFLLNQYQFCYDGTLPQFSLKEKPKNPLNFTILKRNEKEVGEIYFDIQYLYCNYNNNFKFRVFPLFDFEKSWCNDEDVRLFITNNMLPLLHELTIYYYKLLNSRTLELVENKVVPEKIILEKDRIIKKYYQEQAKLIDKIWSTK
jgi:hypothetical protein